MGAVGERARLTGDREIEHVDLSVHPISSGAAALLPVKMVLRHHVVPIGWRFGVPVIAFANPEDMSAVGDVQAYLGQKFIPVAADEAQITSYLEKVYGHEARSRGVTRTDQKPPLANEASGVGAPFGPPTIKDGSGKESKLPPSPPGPLGTTPEREASPRGNPPAASELNSLLNQVLSPEPNKAETVGLQEKDSSGHGELDEALSQLVSGQSDGYEPEWGGLETSLHPEKMIEEDSLLPGEKGVAIPSLASALIKAGKLTLSQIAPAIHEHFETGEPLAGIIARKRLVSEVDLVRAMAEEAGFDFVDLDERAPDLNASRMLPETTARHHHALPIGIDPDGTPVVAVADPTNVFAMDDLRTIIGRAFRVVVSPKSQIDLYISQAYNAGSKVASAAQAAAQQAGPTRTTELADVTAMAEDAPVVRYVNLLILQAINERASDIHVEPTADRLRIRYRIDGVLHDMQSAPLSIAAPVITRLKVIGDMNVAEHRVPQDGRASVMAGNREIDLRLASTPTIYGEKIVMRVLEKANTLLSLEELGFLPSTLERYERAWKKPYGTILVTGPTGSGKSTTLYATLSAINTPDKNLVTIEDPVECRIAGVNQIQLHTKAGLTFTSALRSILRADPDVILVGEIRDKETAMLVIEAALTGHLVLSTLHTNSAATTPMRLVEMGIEPYLVSSAISSVLAQRLVRKLCNHCKEPSSLDPSGIYAQGFDETALAILKNGHLYKAVGCQRCSMTGYYGRIAVGEVLIVNEEIDQLIVERADTEAINKAALTDGMISLRDDALTKVAMGITTLDEVRRVIA